MKRLAMALLAATPLALAGTAALAQDAAISAGKPVYSSDGKLIGPVYRVTASGGAQIIIDGRMVVVPGSTISETDGRLTTTLTRAEAIRPRR